VAVILLRGLHHLTVFTPQSKQAPKTEEAAEQEAKPAASKARKPKVNPPSPPPTPMPSPCFSDAHRLLSISLVLVQEGRQG
jgi:hypothetical protein